MIWLVALFAFIASMFAVPFVLGFFRLFGFYAIVEERTCHVYTLFGKVAAVLDEPGIDCLYTRMGIRALIIGWLGKKYVLDMSLDQTYLRSQPINSEEGAPMGVGIWYEMFVSDPVAYLFRNADPRGSLRANVANSAVRCLSNMKLSAMLESRRLMSQSVRAEVTQKSMDWGFQLGSVYIRKVHLRDEGMIRQIEEKVVNRLRQVTSAIKQDGANQVSIIASSADREAAIEFAKAAALRPQIVGQALQRITSDPDVARALFEVLEVQKILEGRAKITLLPGGAHGSGLLTALLATAPPEGKPLPPHNGGERRPQG